ncbi:MAG: TolC family protein [Alphaproteobacteria bacterium]|nr:TolC family protein [Alphaproteobacteria bacterium]
MRSLLPGVVLAGLLLALPAHAKRTLTYEDAMAAAASSNPTAVSARLAAEQAAEDVRAANGSFDPVLSLSGGYDLNRRSDARPEFETLFFSDSQAWNVNLSLQATAPTGTSATFTSGVTRSIVSTDYQVYGNPIFDPGQLFSTEETRTYVPVFRLALSQELLRGLRLSFNLQNVRQARERLAAGELDELAARQQAMADAARAYWTWVYLVRLAEIATQSVAIAEEDLRVAREQVATGRLASVEATRAEAAMVQARANELQAAQDAAQAADALLLLTGGEPGEVLVPGSTPGEAPVLDLEAARAVGVALQESPALRAAQIRVEAARTLHLDRKHATWPSLTANVQGTMSGAITEGITGLGFGDFVLPSLSVGAVLSVPLGNRAATGAARRQGEEVRRQEALRDSLTAQLKADVEQQVRVLRTARTKIELADVNVRLARETLAAEQALQEVGRGLLKDVLEARTNLERAQGEAFRARTDYRVALVELERLMGRLGQPG